ncbi:MAG: cupin domain-containing protein [Lysobacter sp.]|nr:cupin domain-containing protein [Lysobacter sp.]
MRLVLALCLACASLADARAADRITEPAPRRVFIAGDSTASDYGPERAPRQGWGMQLQSFLDPKAWSVRNHAQNGRSARSFIEQGWLDGIAKDLRAGDVLLVQFGHNDAKLEDPARYNEPHDAFPAWLMRYVALARERGATPILITPVARRKFDRGQLLDTHGLYTLAVRDLAAREGIGLIDLNARSMDWLRALGDEPSKLFFMHVPEARAPDQAQTDDTHLRDAGAVAVACFVVDGWKRLDPALASSVVRDTDCGAKPSSLADRAAQAHPSVILHRDAVVARVQPGPHGGPGETVAHPMFADAKDMPFQFRRRVLRKGAGIGLHPHDHDEIYYVLSGRGRYILDGVVHEVGAGDALLTRTGSTHSIQQAGDEDLVILIVYLSAQQASGR